MSLVKKYHKTKRITKRNVRVNKKSKKKGFKKKNSRKNLKKIFRKTKRKGRTICVNEECRNPTAPQSSRRRRRGGGEDDNNPKAEGAAEAAEAEEVKVDDDEDEVAGARLEARRALMQRLQTTMQTKLKDPNILANDIEAVRKFKSEIKKEDSELSQLIADAELKLAKMKGTYVKGSTEFWNEYNKYTTLYNYYVLRLTPEEAMRFGGNYEKGKTMVIGNINKYDENDDLYGSGIIKQWHYRGSEPVGVINIKGRRFNVKDRVSRHTEEDRNREPKSEGKGLGFGGLQSGSRSSTLEKLRGVYKE